MSSSKFFTALGLFSAFFWTSVFGAPASADQSTPLLHMISGPSPQIQCDFLVTVDSANLLTGGSYSCSGEDLETYGVDRPRTMTLDQLRDGVVFMRQEDYGIDVIIVSAPDLNAKVGGHIRIHYLRNAIFLTYNDFYATIENNQGHWQTTVDDGDGVHPITQMTVTTGLLGVKKIRAR